MLSAAVGISNFVNIGILFSWTALEERHLQNRAISMEYDPIRYHGKEGINRSEVSTSGSAVAIDSSNKGFQLLKKHGWKEGSGLGASEQGRLEPVETHVKNNKRGVGADKGKKKMLKPTDHGGEEQKNGNEHPASKKKKRGITKKMRKMQELEKKLQEQEFQRAFFREFWPDNV